MASDKAAKRLAMQKMAFEVAWRILRATPINATGLVSALLLTTNGVALTLTQVHHTVQDSLDYLERYDTPMTDSALRLRSLEGPARRSTRCPGASDDPHRQWPRTRVAYRAAGQAPGRVLPQHDHPCVPRDLDRRAFALAMPRGVDGDRLDAFWARP